MAADKITSKDLEDAEAVTKAFNEAFDKITNEIVSRRSYFKPYDFEIPIKLKASCCRPVRFHDSEWYDLSVPEEVQLMPGEYVEIPLGVAMQLPEGYEAIIAPRSSTFKRYRCLAANSIGIIDNKYCGDGDWWTFPVFSTSHMTIPFGTRICQFRIQKCNPRLCFTEVDSLGNIDRKGIGSTGV